MTFGQWLRKILINLLKCESSLHAMKYNSNQGSHQLHSWKWSYNWRPIIQLWFEVYLWRVARVDHDAVVAVAAQQGPDSAPEHPFTAPSGITVGVEKANHRSAIWASGEVPLATKILKNIRVTDMKCSVLTVGPWFFYARLGWIDFNHVICV